MGSLYLDTNLYNTHKKKISKKVKFLGLAILNPLLSIHTKKNLKKKWSF